MIHTVVSLIVYVGQATETENYFNFLLKRALKNFRANSISGDGTFRRIRCGPKTIKLIHEIVCFSIIGFYLHAVSIYDVSLSTYYRLHSIRIVRYYFYNNYNNPVLTGLQIPYYHRGF